MTNLQHLLNTVKSNKEQHLELAKQLGKDLQHGITVDDGDFQFNVFPEQQAEKTNVRKTCYYVGSDRPSYMPLPLSRQIELLRWLLQDTVEPDTH